MTTLLAPADALAESRRLMQVLEQHRGELPFADEFLAAHRPTHQQLEESRARADHAVAAWRAALAHRWDCEVAGRRLYKQIYQQMIAVYGSTDAPEVLLISRGGAEAESSPEELLSDLRRLEVALALNRAHLPFAAARLEHLSHICEALAEAVHAANLREAERRASVLTLRMVQELYRRRRDATRQALLNHYGEHTGVMFDDLFV